MNATTAAQIQKYIAVLGAGSTYANEATLRRFRQGDIALLQAAGLADKFHAVTIAEGPKAGRVTPVLAFDLGEQVPSDAIPFAFAGILVFTERPVRA